MVMRVGVMVMRVMEDGDEGGGMVMRVGVMVMRVGVMVMRVMEDGDEGNGGW